MKYKFLLILSLITFSSFSQHDNSPLGARQAAMSGTSACIEDIWSVHNNQAGLANLNTIQAGIYYEDRYLLKELSLKCFAFALPVKSGVFGLEYNNFGFKLYNENKLGLAFSRKLYHNVSAGIQLDYFYTHIAEGYGNRGLMTFEAGIRTQLNQKLVIAAHVFNPLQSKLSDYNNETVPSIIKIGAMYTSSAKVNLSAEVEKNINNKPDFRAGVESIIIKNIYVRAGISTFPESFAFGFGFDYRKLRLDFASSYQQTLGYSPQFSMIYIFN